MSKPLISRFTFGFSAVIFFALLLRAQVENGTVVGTVRDTTGATIPNASVAVVNADTNISTKVMTNDAGEYVAAELKPGSYSVTIQAQGFKQFVKTGITLTVNQIARVDTVLELGSGTQRVDVTAAAPQLETQTSSIGQVIEGQEVHTLPLNGRNFIELAYLTPGVNAGPAGIVQQGGIPENERASGAIQANGLTATNNNFLLNGFDNNEQNIGFEVVYPSIDAIEEFKVQTNNFGADIGKGGAVVNLVLKSGTNSFHGDVYEFLRNSAFDAKNYFDDPTLPIAPFRQNQFGGTFGGPLKRDKAFFFGDYQGTRIRQALTTVSTVPLPNERGGNFSDLLTGIKDPVTGDDTGQIFDPLTYNPANGARQPFAGNIIPPSRLDPAAINVVNLFPLPNRPGTTNNYLSNPELKQNQDSFDIRGDDQLTSEDSLSLFFSFGNSTSLRPDPFPGLAGGGLFSGNVKNNDRAAGITDVHAFAPNKINEVKLGYFRYTVNAIQNFAGQAVAASLGIPGINDPHNLVATGGLTNIAISGLSPLGNQCCFPEFLNEDNYQVLDSFTYVRGQHSFKMGADLRRRLHGFFQALNPQGAMTFDPLFTEDLRNGEGGSPLASFLLGYPSTVTRDEQQGLFGDRWWEFSSYFLDDWRITHNFTINLGLRYDIFTPMVEQHDRLANFDFATGKFISPQQAGVSPSGNVQTKFHNFAPRVGFAYSPGGGAKTVVRGGYGIFYDLQATQNDAELPFNPTGLFLNQTINNNPTTPTLRLSQGLPTPTYATIDDPSGRASAALFQNPTTYIEDWNIDVERQLAGNMLLQVAYVGTRGVHMTQLMNLNQPMQPLDANFLSAPNFGRPYFDKVPNVGPIRTEVHNYNLIANALEIKFEKRFSHGWNMLNAYTWQHTIGQSEEDEYNEPQDTYNLRAERGDNGPDFRHQFTSAWTYELPFGPGKAYWNGSGPMRWIVGGWQLNGIVALYSGQAFTPYLSFDPTNTGSGGPRPDAIGNPYNFSSAMSAGCPSDQQSLQCWYNPAAFAIPPLAPGQSIAHEFGNAGRGTLRGPAQYNVDASIFKDFRFTEGRMVQFRAEVFNLFNTPQFAIPNAFVDTPGAGSISSTVHSPRQIQLALKLFF